MENITDRFLRYVSIDTQSDPDSESQPSSRKQLNLSRLLVEELKAFGLQAELDSFGYVMAKLPSNIDRKVPAIGFISHVDTAPDASGANIRPRIIRDYDGKDIVLNKERDIVLRTSEFPEMLQYRGKTLITTDGTTLLGADDKAGVAEIMTAVQYMTAHPEFRHGDIMIGFTPDEEIGRGVDRFDVGKFGADYAYTMDGGEIGELEYENFNAAGVKIHIQGSNVHPGSAKNKMVNSILIAAELNSMLPVAQRPEHTEGYEGFFHIIAFNGTVEETTIQYIIRDHDMEKFKQKKELMQSCVEFINAKYSHCAKLDMEDQYYNMKKEIEPHYFIIEKAIEAFRMADVEPKIQPIRGGTDGARLSFMNLPCPNIFAGGHNFHGKYEYIPVESMEKAVQIILNLAELFAR